MSTFNSGKLYPPNSSVPIKRIRLQRAPTNEYKNFTEGDEWLDTVTSIWYKFLRFDPVLLGVWGQLANPGDDIDTLTGDDATPVEPLNHNVTIRGNSGGVNGAINFASPGVGLLNAQVRVDGTTIIINGSNQLSDPSGPTNVDTLQTTDGASHIIVSIPVAENSSVSLSGFLIAAQSDYSNAVEGDIQVGAYRAALGNVTMIGVPLINVQSTSVATFASVVNIGTQSLDITVTGVNPDTYDWKIEYRFITQ